MYRIGITERGDASLSYKWKDGIDSTIASILITKNVTAKFIEEVLKYKNKVIIHATVTGWGGTRIEPNVPSYEHSYSQIRKLISLGFPSNQIVLRIDPIFTTEEGLQRVDKVLSLYSDLGLNRVRFSFLDKYKHVVEKFLAEGIDNKLPMYSFNKPYPFNIKQTFKIFDKYKGDYIFEACSEQIPYNDNVFSIGCISKLDLDILNIDIELEGSSFQRSGCICPANKFELLSDRHPCAHNCLYCYWKR